MSIPENLLYTKQHEWIKVDGSKGVAGITHFAQDQLGDVVFVDPPQPGAALTKDQAMGVVESVKTVSDLYAPVTGAVTSANKELEAQPELVNQDPYGKGWLIELDISDTAELDTLLSAEKYAEFIQEEH
jgi:glycine cleavage system H protein